VALVLVGTFALGLGVTVEVAERRDDGFCTAAPDTFERRSWLPLGERCYRRLPDGTVAVRRPGWALTVFTAVVVAGIATGATAPAGTARRRLAWALVVPLVPLAVVIAVAASPRSLSRLVAIATISLGLTAIPALVTAVAAARLLVTGWWAAMGGSWLAWGIAVFIAGRDGVRP
jgi:hypothetical protein